MNRIILIGNGFDLAHGLKTSYANFIDWYWKEWGKRLLHGLNKVEDDGLVSFKLNKEAHVNNWAEVREWNYKRQNPFEPWDENMILEQAKTNRELCDFVITSPLLQELCKQLEERNWVDVENVFYELLRSGKEQPKKLNDDLDIIRGKLIEYLIIVQDDIKNGLVNEGLKKKMFEPVCFNDVALSSIEQWMKLIQLHLSYSSQDWDLMREDYSIDEKDPDYLKLKKFINVKKRNKVASDSLDTIFQKVTDFLPKLSFEYNNPGDVKKKLEKSKRYKAPALFFLPDRVLLLNFNYLSTADMYFPVKNNRFKVNHIHGILSSPKSVIFGYGDELDKNYKSLSEKNDNEYLRNIKSIKYLEATNYRSLLEFIESDAYQIYIMGHSCGNSDRTLLNTLFEHKNCVSIKPFYFIRKDGTDNYMELVQNISRNFTDMKLMRDRVVNKTFCEPYSDAREKISYCADTPEGAKLPLP